MFKHRHARTSSAGSSALAGVLSESENKTHTQTVLSVCVLLTSPTSLSCYSEPKRAGTVEGRTPLAVAFTLAEDVAVAVA